MTASPARRPIARISPVLRLAATSLVLLLAACTSNPPQSEPRQTDNQHRPAQHRFFSFSGHSDGQQCLAEWRGAPALQPDLWDRIQKNYRFKDSLKAGNKNERINTERNWYANHQAYLDRMSGRASRYLYHVAGELEKRDLPGELALLPVVESAYNPFAYSRSQASGLWQFIPSTAKHLEMDMNWWYDERRDIVGSTSTALDYLVFLRDHYDGDWLKALAAYNAGWGTIDRAVAKNKAKGLPTDYWSLDVPAETQAYVPKLLALAQISRNPDAYGVHWAYIPDLPYFAEVNIDSQMDVSRAADMAGISSDELYLLNPGISRWATPPGKSYRLLVPIDQANELQERVANLSAEDRLQWTRYTVQPGDSLGKIAKRFNTSPDLIQNVNNKSAGQIAAGTELLMPVADHRMPAQITNPRVQEMEQKVASNQKIVSSSGRTYVVQAKDTLSIIARKQNTTVAELQKLNKLDKNEPLKLGQTLALPGTTKTAATATPEKPGEKQTAANNTADKKLASKKPTSLDTGSNRTAYKVQSGDTLMAIARKHKLNVDDIARWNALDKNRYTLQPGQMLTLYLGQRSKF